MFTSLLKGWDGQSPFCVLGYFHPPTSAIHPMCIWQDHLTFHQAPGNRQMVFDWSTISGDPSGLAASQLLGTSVWSPIQAAGKGKPTTSQRREMWTVTLIAISDILGVADGARTGHQDTGQGANRPRNDWTRWYHTGQVETSSGFGHLIRLALLPNSCPPALSVHFLLFSFIA